MIDKFPARRNSAERMGKLEGRGGGGRGGGGGSWDGRPGGFGAAAGVQKVWSYVDKYYLNSAFFKEKQGYGGKTRKKQDFFFSSC